MMFSFVGIKAVSIIYSIVKCFMCHFSTSLHCNGYILFDLQTICAVDGNDAGEF